MINHDNAPILNLLEEGLTKEQLQQRIVQYVTDYTAQSDAEAEQRILEKARQNNDQSIMQARGANMLTSDELKFYESLGEFVQNKGFVQGVTAVPLPETIIERVFEDLQATHPLLNCVEFVTAPAKVEFVYNTDQVKKAVWGNLTAAITQELETGFKTINLTAGKLSAYLPVHESMIELGPVWLDRYVRTVLGEAIAEGLEDGIVNGTGKDQPIGMMMDLSKETQGTYTAKKAEVITALDKKTYATILSKLSKAEGGKDRTRNVNEVLMFVNPTTYLAKVYPAVTYKNVNGSYVEAFPFPTKVVTSAAVPANKAIFGLDKQYFFGACSDKGGKIEDSDHVKFLDDQRVYKIKMYGTGTPKDNNSYVVADITGLVETLPVVETKTAGAGV